MDAWGSRGGCREGDEQQECEPIAVEGVTRPASATLMARDSRRHVEAARAGAPMKAQSFPYALITGLAVSSTFMKTRRSDGSTGKRITCAGRASHRTTPQHAGVFSSWQVRGLLLMHTWHAGLLHRQKPAPPQASRCSPVLRAARPVFGQLHVEKAQGQDTLWPAPPAAEGGWMGARRVRTDSTEAAETGSRSAVQLKLAILLGAVPP